MNIGMELDDSLDQVVELEGGTVHALETLEELRLTLKSFMTPRVLDAILEMFKFLEAKPDYPTMYAWFMRNSQFGGECRYALSAVKSFKEQRLDRTIHLLERCLKELKELKNDNN